MQIGLHKVVPATTLNWPFTEVSGAAGGAQPREDFSAGNFRTIKKGEPPVRLITKDVDYGVRALVCMARSEVVLLNVTDLARETGIPRPFLRKILQRLTRAGILKSTKGKGGGFAFLRDPWKINLAEIINIFQCGTRVCDHRFNDRPCPHGRGCRLKAKLEKIECVLTSGLKEITIAALCPPPRRR